MGATPTIPSLPATPAKPIGTWNNVIPGGSGLSSTPSTVPGAAVVPGNTSQGTGVGTINPSGVSISSGLSTADGSHTLVGDFKDTYGAGTGTALADTLAGLGTATDKAVTATNQSILDAAGRQQANLQANQAAHGVSTDSSASALALGDFTSQVSQEIATTDSNMELTEENILIDALQKEGTQHGGDSSFMSSLGDFFSGGGLGAVGAVAGAVDSLPGTGGGALGSTLDFLSML